MGRGTVFGSFLATVVLIGACDDPVLPPTSLTVSPSPVTLALGETARLTTSLRDENGGAVIALVSWSSSAPAVVSVTDGLITALRPGTAEITASTEGLTASASVKVVDRESPAVTILNPLSGATVEGAITVAARVNDDHQVGRISLSVDGIEVDSAQPTPGTAVTTTLSWNSEGADEGAHTLVVEATDSTGNIGSASISVNIDTPPFVLSISGSVTASAFNTATAREECTSVITATAVGGGSRARAEWLSGLREFRNVHGIVMTTDTLDAGDLLDLFGSSHISTGSTQVVNRIDRNTSKFDLFYTFRAALPDSTKSSIDVFLDCN